MLTYRDGKMASLYATMLAQTDRRGLINGTNGYIEIENINNYEMVRVFNLERKIVAEYTAPTQITGYEYEVQSVMRAIREGRIECPEMPHSEILRMMQLMDSIRSAWNIVFPFEKDNTIRITADNRNASAPANDAQAKKEAQNRQQKSVVRKISEKSVSDTEYENTEKPKASNAKDARDMLPPSPHKGITDKLPKNIDFAAPKDNGTLNKKLKEVPVLKKPVSETAKAEEHEKNEHEAKPEYDTKPEYETESDIKREEKTEEEQVQEVFHKDKSPTEQIRNLDLGIEAVGSGDVGSVTDKIKKLVIEEELTDKRTVTGRIGELEIQDEDKSSEFQRKRSEPTVKGWNGSIK